MHMQSLGRHQNLNAFARENPLHLSRETSGSSRVIICGPDWIIVTWLPNRR